MKATLIAASKLTKNIPAEHYGHADDISRNPVYITFFRDYQSILDQLKNKRDAASNKKFSNAVLALWRDFEMRLDKDYISDKLSELTKILLDQKEYEVAKNHCIDRLLLRHFTPVRYFNFNKFEDVINLLHNYNLQESSHMIEALVNRHVCQYKMLLEEDYMLNRLCSLENLTRILKSLTFILQEVFVNEKCQWIVFNVDQLKWCVDWSGVRVPRTIIFNDLPTHPISPHAIITITLPGKCVEVVEVDEFNWRMQLTLALCQCYYDSGQSAWAETWARKMVVEMTKVREKILSIAQLFTSKTALIRVLNTGSNCVVTNVTTKLGGSGGCSSGGSNKNAGGCGGGKEGSTGGCPVGSYLINTELHGEADLARLQQQLLLTIRCYSIKFSFLIFKRAAVESRRRPEGFMEPTNRFHANQLTQMPWPRSGTERLLDLMFEGSACQFLAIMTCLHDLTTKSCLRVRKEDTEEIEVLDVHEELFFAAQEILSGGGGDKKKGIGGMMAGVGSMLKGVVEGRGTMFCMALQGSNGVCVGEVVEFLKLSYSYNQRSIINVLLNKLIDVLEKTKNDDFCGYLLELKVIKLVDKLTEMRRIKEDFVSDPILYPYIENHVLELVQCVEQLVVQNGDHSMVIDALILSWKKLRCFLLPPTILPLLVTTTHQPEESMVCRVLRLMQKDANLTKWVEVMLVMVRVMGGELGGGYMGVHSVPVLLQTTIFLGLLYEGMSTYFPEFALHPGVTHNLKCPNDVAIETLSKAKHVFENGLSNVEKLQDILSCNLQHYGKMLNDFLMLPAVDSCALKPVEEESGEVLEMRVLLAEVQAILTTLLLRVTIKLSHFIGSDAADCKEVNLRDYTPVKFDKDNVKASNGLLSTLLCGSKNRMTEALKRAVQAVVVQHCCPVPAGGEGIKKSYQLLHKMATEESAFIHHHNLSPHLPQCPPCQQPTISHPILIHKTNHTLLFKAPTFFHPCVSYFKLFGCLATPAKRNKAGYLDTELKGCGVMVSATPQAFFRVTGLLPGQRYVFCAGVYDRDGEMIGDKIGPCTHPILTTNPASFHVASIILDKVAGI